MSRFIKISSTGEHLPDDAPEWVAVLDEKQGLMWSKDHIAVDNYQQALTVLDGFDLAGVKDWRLPTVEELFLLADRTRANPAIDTAYFPDCASDWYWTSTIYASSPGDCAWGVGFSGGGACWGGLGCSGFVRACRAGQ
jgi:Protein of unknown function (DUF1566)